MQVTAETKEWRVVVRLDSEVEEASYVYDLVQSGRLQVSEKDRLPLPFRGQFLFKLPAHPRPIAIQVRDDNRGIEVKRGQAYAADTVGSTSAGHQMKRVDRQKKNEESP